MNSLRSLALPALVLSPLMAHAGLTSITVANPSFQADSFGGVGYANTNGGIVTGWNLNNAGGMGVTGVDQPGGAHFIDGVTMDGTRAGFIQGAGIYSQNLNGLNPGQRYVFQAWLRPRNCCGDSPVASADYNGQALISNQLLTAGSPWQAFSVPFIAGSSSGALSIGSAASAGGDASLALDSIQVFQLDSDYVNILNPSFESGIYNPFPGYQGSMAGWTITGPGGGGYNFAGNSAFADNGVYPEGSTVAFLQNSASLSQLLTGLTAGQQYLLELDYNAREGTGSGQISVDLGGTNLLSSSVNPVGGSNPWHHLAAPWTAGGSSATLSIAGIQVGGDSAITFDNITLRAIPEPSTAMAALFGFAALGLRRRRA